MSYWRTYYPDKIGNKDFIEGACAAVYAYAVYRNGVAEIGSPERPYQEAQDEIKKDLEYKED